MIFSVLNGFMGCYAQDVTIETYLTLYTSKIRRRMKLDIVELLKRTLEWKIIKYQLGI